MRRCMEMSELISPMFAESPLGFDRAAALASYRQLVDRYAGTLDLLSGAAHADFDRLIDEGERYADVLERWAPQAQPLLDLGTGVGLPGVMVAIRFHPRAVWWVERRRRRTAFLTQVAALARLEGVRIFGSDVRDVTAPAAEPTVGAELAEGAALANPVGVAAITAQGVGSFVQVAQLTEHLLAPGTILLSRKGPDGPREVEALQLWWSERRPGEALPRMVEQLPLGGRGSLIAVAFGGG